MDSILNLETMSRVLTFSTGIFAGMNFGLSMVAVPAILESNDPLPVWRMVYTKASKIAVVSLLCSSTTAAVCFVKKNGMGMDNVGLAAVGILSFSVIPYTLIMMKPINDHLFSLNIKEEAKKVKEIVGQWGTLHWVRTVIGVAVFGIQVFKIGQP